MHVNKKAKRSGGFCPLLLLKFRFSLGYELQKLFVTGFTAEDFKQVFVDALAILITLV
jgi:hypothetical protein